MCRSLLVYDGRRRVFRSLADTVTDRMGNARAVPWQSGPVQRFLDAQFDDRPFVFVLVEDDEVHVGDEAVARVVELVGFGAVGALARRGYPVIAGPFGRLVHGREPADIHGTFPLESAARTHVESLRACADC